MAAKPAVSMVEAPFSFLTTEQLTAPAAVESIQ